MWIRKFESLLSSVHTDRIDDDIVTTNLFIDRRITIKVVIENLLTRLYIYECYIPNFLL